MFIFSTNKYSTAITNSHYSIKQLTGLQSFYEVKLVVPYWKKYRFPVHCE